MEGCFSAITQIALPVSLVRGDDEGGMDVMVQALVSQEVHWWGGGGNRESTMNRTPMEKLHYFRTESAAAFTLIFKQAKCLSFKTPIF